MRFLKTLFWSVEALHSRCDLARRLLQIGVLGVQPSGGQKGGSRRVLNWQYKEDEKLFYLPVRPKPLISLF